MSNPIDLFSLYTYKSTGVKHLFKDKPCEDSVSKKISKDRMVSAISVSDGAGSRKHSLEGSSLVSDTATTILVNNFEAIWKMSDDEASNFIISEVCKPLSIAADANGWLMDDMLATLICVAMHEDGRYIAFHVGDGVVVGYSKTNKATLLSQYNHEYASHIVTFINAPNPTYKIIRGKNDYSSFLLTSDGAEPYLMPGGEVAAQAIMMQQASFILSTQDMKEYMDELTDTLKNECHADDDISFAIISDNRKIESVFNDMNDELLEVLMDVRKIESRKKSEYSHLIKMLHYYPKGIHWKKLCREMYLHKKSRLYKKLNRLFPGEFIEFNNGRIYLR